MNTFDFSPLFRSTVGFDRLMNLLENSVQWSETSNGYPPYNIEKTGEDQYRISIAVAGFSEDELAIEARQNALLVEGRKKDADAGNTFLYRGIAGRSFKRQFQLADHVKVTGAQLKNGLLVVDLVRELPEAMKPRRVEIKSAAQAAVCSENIQRLMNETWEKKVGGRLEFIPEGEEIVRRALDHIDRKRAALNLPVYDPSKWGKSGDTRMPDLIALPLEERLEAVYGVSVPAK